MKSPWPVFEQGDSNLVFCAAFIHMMSPLFSSRLHIAAYFMQTCQLTKTSTGCSRGSTVVVISLCHPELCQKVSPASNVGDNWFSFWYCWQRAVDSLPGLLSNCSGSVSPTTSPPSYWRLCMFYWVTLKPETRKPPGNIKARWSNEQNYTLCIRCWASYAVCPLSAVCLFFLPEE